MALSFIRRGKFACVALARRMLSWFRRLLNIKMNKIIAFDHRLINLCPIRLRVEACHRHSLVLSMSECPPEFSDRKRRLVVWLHPARGLVPFGLRCDSLESFKLLPKTIGVTARLYQNQFVFEHGATFELTGAGVSLRVLPSDDALSNGLARARQAFIQRQISNDSPHPEPLASALQKRLDTLISRLCSGDFETNGGLLRPLIGLGLGSTPSGDDMIAGVLAALWTIHSAHALAARSAISQEIHGICPSQTTKTSRDMLWHAANGYFPEALGNVAKGLRDQNCDSEEFRRRVENLFSVGATSGRDMGMGILKMALKFIF